MRKIFLYECKRLLLSLIHILTITMSEQAAIAAEVRFADQTEVYTLYVTPRIEAENLAVRALVQICLLYTSRCVEETAFYPYISRN